jgi:hypothetical protein
MLRYVDGCHVEACDVTRVVDAWLEQAARQGCVDLAGMHERLRNGLYETVDKMLEEQAERLTAKLPGPDARNWADATAGSICVSLSLPVIGWRRQHIASVIRCSQNARRLMPGAYDEDGVLNAETTEAD